MNEFYEPANLRQFISIITYTDLFFVKIKNGSSNKMSSHNDLEVIS